MTLAIKMIKPVPREAWEIRDNELNIEKEVDSVSFNFETTKKKKKEAD